MTTTTIFKSTPDRRDRYAGVVKLNRAGWLIRRVYRDYRTLFGYDPGSARLMVIGLLCNDEMRPQ